MHVTIETNATTDITCVRSIIQKLLEERFLEGSLTAELDACMRNHRQLARKNCDEHGGTLCEAIERCDELGAGGTNDVRIFGENINIFTTNELFLSRDSHHCPTWEVRCQLQDSSRRSPPRIAVKSKGKILFIGLHDVIAIKAEGNYVLLQRQAGSDMLRESISAMAEKLKSYGFIRIHRSALVNTSFVEEIHPRPNGDYGLRVKGGKEYTVTRKYKKNLSSLAELWVGTGSFLAE